VGNAHDVKMRPSYKAVQNSNLAPTRPTLNALVCVPSPLALTVVAGGVALGNFSVAAIPQ
jgi:hypothetical protein